MTGSSSQVTARARIADLVARFKENEADYLGSTYNETQARTDFITPLLVAFGWDVHNHQGHQLALREVIEEATVDVGEEMHHKRPDYELRRTGQRKLFIEAKKPRIRIDTDPVSAFQIRRYGFSAGLPISVLTNFRQLAIYDCRTVPSHKDSANKSRRLIVPYCEFEEHFDELWSLLSREAVYSEAFDWQFEATDPHQKVELFDNFFLAQVCDWRKRLADDIHANAPHITSTDLTYFVQVFLSRIIFLRICEDRNIEQYETLRNLGVHDTFDALMNQLKRADEFYNSGLFQLMDDTGLGVRISDAVLTTIINELYYPDSPYTFAVVEPEGSRRNL